MPSVTQIKKNTVNANQYVYYKDMQSTKQTPNIKEFLNCKLINFTYGHVFWSNSAIPSSPIVQYPSNTFFFQYCVFYFLKISLSPFTNHMCTCAWVHYTISFRI